MQLQLRTLQSRTCRGSATQHMRAMLPGRPSVRQAVIRCDGGKAGPLGSIWDLDQLGAAVSPAKPKAATSTANNIVPQNLTRPAAAGHVDVFRVPPKIYFKSGCLEVALSELNGVKKRALVISEKYMNDAGYPKRVTTLLDSMRIQSQVWSHAEFHVGTATLVEGLKKVQELKPDVVIAVGGGSSIDTAKVLHLLYESQVAATPEAVVKYLGTINSALHVEEDARTDASHGVAGFVKPASLLIAIPTTSGTGAEVTPYAAVLNSAGRKCTLADYRLIPNMAVVDPQLVAELPVGMAALGGLRALDHALEAYVSNHASDYTCGLARQAVTGLFEFLPRSVKSGANDMAAREKVHYAATLAGMALANSALGMGHSMAYVLSKRHGLLYGFVRAQLMVHVMRFTAGSSADAAEAYAELGTALNLGGTTTKEKSDRLIAAVDDLRLRLGVAPNLRTMMGVEKHKDYTATVEEMAKQVANEIPHDDAHPHPPTLANLKEIFLAAW